jgi:glutamyl-tRNA(Gln) amidotransferase subunit E
LYIGRILRATGKVKRGIGTIRQDINVSIRDGARQEIKGIQELSLISTVIEREVQRQIALLEIRDELKRRGAAKIKKRFINVTEVFSGTGSRVIRDAIAKGGIVLAAKLPKFADLIGKELQPGRRFGTELADLAKIYGKVGGIFHTDELPACGISAEEVEKLKNVTKASPEDAVVIVADLKERAEKALDAIIDRANKALEGVPEGTRRALPNGNTEYMRPLPGAARMYVETDIPPITITERRVKEIKKRLPELPEIKQRRFIEVYRLSEDLAKRMSLSENVWLFEQLVKKYKVEPTLVATTLEETLVELKREGIPIHRIQESAFGELFDLISKGRLAKEAIPDVLREVAKGVRVRVAVKRLGLERMTKVELLELISKVIRANRELIKKRGMAALKPLMGIVMGKVRGRADGKLVYKLLEGKLRKLKLK